MLGHAVFLNNLPKNLWLNQLSAQFVLRIRENTRKNSHSQEEDQSHKPQHFNSGWKEYDKTRHYWIERNYVENCRLKMGLQYMPQRLLC